jgi:phosphatidylglycerol:prolipoprotein diacylglycerol transferase
MYVHDLDPFLLQISGDFGIRWYGMSYLAGFLMAHFTISWLAQRQRAGLSAQMVSDFITYGAIGVLVGARFGYCLFYAPDLLIKFKSSFPFWGAIAVNEGGMSSHGGMIGLVLGCILFSRKYGVHMQYLFDLVAVAGPLGIMMGRAANFINGELVGRPADPNFPLAVKFPQDILSWPTYEFGKLSSLSDVVPKIGVTSDQWMQWLNQYQSSFEIRDSVYNTLTKIVQAVQSGQTEVKNALAEHLIARHPSQIYALLSEGLFVFLALFIYWRKPRKPGTVGALFLITYSLARFSDELFRMPDAHIGLDTLGVSRGQWLSIVMFFVGLVLFIFWSRSNSLAIDGWRTDRSVRLGRR